VIPLRPLGVGEILDGAVSTMRTHWRTVLGISLALSVVMETAVLLVQKFALDNNANVVNNPNPSVRELSRAMGEALLNSGVVLLIVLVATVAATGLLAPVTSQAVLGKSAIAEARRLPRPQLTRLLGLSLLLPLMFLAIVAVGTLPGVLVAATASTSAGASLAFLGGLGASVAALWIVIRYSLAAPALMLERQSIRKSLSRSAKLVRGSWWRIFGIQLLGWVIAVIVSSLIVIPFAVIAVAFGGDSTTGFLHGTASTVGWTFLVVSGIGSVIGRMITFPLSAGVTMLLYIDQRIRREALDLDLARAAGLEGYGFATPGSTPGS
jgi:hypothetical protein